MTYPPCLAGARRLISQPFVEDMDSPAGPVSAIDIQAGETLRGLGHQFQAHHGEHDSAGQVQRHVQRGSETFSASQQSASEVPDGAQR
ncbi:hypothetical protein GCM10009789_37850 [Kribbella sancticallisti]|uniref:Uncharacterized protein n=1 Tax=Kribbella sancticallisti TaxID=460087 RepID=A0ABP4PNA2_9ACTN